MAISRPALLAGVAGPVLFVGSWAVAGAIAEGYSPVSDTISRLAQQGAPTRPLMTAGLLGFGALMPVYAHGLGRALNSPGVRAVVTASGLATIAVAAFPLTGAGGTRSDTAHYYSAAAAYLCDILAPLLAAGHLRNPRARRASYATAAAVAASLLGSLRSADHTGLLQRTGLTLYDLWAIALALGLPSVYGTARTRPARPA